MEQIAKLSLALSPISDVKYNPSQVAALGPMLQGFLMERVGGDYAATLHAMVFNPYSQYCTMEDNGDILWTVSALNSEAVSRIIEPLSSIEAVALKAAGQSFDVKGKKMKSMGIDRLLDALKSEGEAKHRIKFASPTAFKSRGEYVILPNSRLIFQNLLMHYGQVYAGSNEVEEETLAYIADHSKVTAYNLRSRYFAHSRKEKTKIPAFAGELTLCISGSQPMQGLASMLLRFGEYAGVGIKTSMGMGGMQLLQAR